MAKDSYSCIINNRFDTMADINVKVYHNTENNSTAHNQHFDGIVDACEQLWDAYNISYYVDQEPDDFYVDHSQGRIDMLDDFEKKLHDKGLMDSSDTTYFLSYDTEWFEGWEGISRYNTGQPSSSNWDREYEDVGEYGLAIAGWNNTNAAYNVAAHEVLHTYDVWHPDGSVYFTDEESPMATGQGDENHNFCDDEGSPNKYSSALSTCAKSAADSHVSQYL